MSLSFCSMVLFSLVFFFLCTSLVDNEARTMVKVWQNEVLDSVTDDLSFQIFIFRLVMR